MKRCLLILICALALLSAVSCGSAPVQDDVVAWKSDVELPSLAASLDNCLAIDLQYMEDAEDDWYDYVLCADRSLYESGLVRSSAKDSDISEYGIFKAGEGQDTAKIADMIKAYVKIRQDSWDDRYLKDQHPKLLSASVFTCGDYVFYTILSDSEKADFEATAKTLLKAE